MPEHMRGDDTLGGQDGSDYQYTHRNKRSVTLNLKEAEGISVLKRLIATADVVVENFRPDVKFRLGIDYQTLCKDHPRLVYASISGFGQTGPLAERPGFDQIAQGMGGLMSVTGLPGQGPVRVGIPIADSVRGYFCGPGHPGRAARARNLGQRAMAAHLAARSDGVHDGLSDVALAHRRRSRRPGRQLSSDQHSHRRLQGARRVHEHRGVRLENLGALLRNAGRAGMGQRRAFSRQDGSLGESRCAQRRDQSAPGHEDRAYWIERFNADGVACGHINNVQEVFEEPQIEHLHMVQDVVSEHLGAQRLVGQPMQLERTPSRIARAAPRRGEHTEEILGELGFGADDLVRMKSKGMF